MHTARRSESGSPCTSCYHAHAKHPFFLKEIHWETTSKQRLRQAGSAFCPPIPAGEQILLKIVGKSLQ
jgi:hypothetical protein